MHNLKLDTIIQDFGTDIDKGLTLDQVIDRRQKYGENKLREKKKKTIAQYFFEQFKDTMIIILIAAACISFGIAIVQRNLKELFEPVLILLIVIINAIMGVLQERKAEKALEALKNMSAPYARVIRNGEEQLIAALQLVPGDIIRLEAGDFVPADARLIYSASLKSEEAALTGESIPSEKNAHADIKGNAPIGDRTNMIFSGCSITYGTATAVITAIGMNTEMGKIAYLLEDEEQGQTPLQKKLTSLGKYLGVVALVACTVIFIVGLIEGMRIFEIFMIAVSLAVSAIPEGLPAVVTIVLSIGVQRMVKKNTIIRRLPAVETLGSASVICSDKTGTLTQNRMTLVKVYVDGAQDLENISKDNNNDVRKLLMYGTLCSNGSVVLNDFEEKHIGDPTETSIVLAAYKNGMTKEELNKKYPRIAEIPFDSDRKLMTSINKIDGKNIVIVKGAFDVLASKCINGDIKVASEKNNEMAKDALRVIAIAYKEITQVPDEPYSNELENDLTFMGVVGIIDPPRPGVKEAVDVCRNAGIKPIMITGDHIITASAIAKELGILLEGHEAITGAELDSMTDIELDSRIANISVYSRVSPENKIRIVRAWQKRGDVVSMTGDGVNDAPALKAADIGCAMGITGTDVAKGAADMTLTDDNFATIVDAIKEGRGIYANIKKVVGFLLGTNTGELLTVFFAMVLWKKTPLLSMQLLWINLVTDSMPAIALGMEDVEGNIMQDKPKSKKEGIFAHGMGVRIVLQGFMFALLTLIGFKIGENISGQLAGGQTMAFLVLSLSQVVQAFNMRSNRSLIRTGVFTNYKLNVAALISALLIFLVLFTPVSSAFKLIYMPFYMYMIGIGLSFIPLLIIELSKNYRINDN